MAFADVLATLNQGLGNVTGTPLGQLGLQLMAQSGYQPGNPSGGARLGNALAGMGQMQQRQQLAQYRQQLLQQQEADYRLRQQAAQAKADQERQYQQSLQDPAVLAQLGPLARQMAALGVDPGELIRAQSADNLQSHRAATLARIGAGAGESSGPRMPTQRQVLDEPLGDGQMQRHVLNPQTGQYEKYGEPFNQYSPGRKAKPTPALDAAVDELAPAPEGQPDLSALPGSGGLQSYAPQAQGPVGVLPMAAAGGGVQPARKAKAAVDDNLKAASAAIASGKSRQAVIARLKQAGYSDADIGAAGI